MPFVKRMGCFVQTNSIEQNSKRPRFGRGLLHISVCRMFACHSPLGLGGKTVSAKKKIRQAWRAGFP